MSTEERKVPELRFKGFSDDWEQRLLKNELALLKDGTHGTHKNSEEGPFLLSAKNIKNGSINITNDDRKISYEEYNKIHKNFNLKKGDILLTIVGTIGETAILQDPKDITFQRSVAYLRPLNLITTFLYNLLNTPHLQIELKRRQVVSAQPGIYLGDLKKINISITNNIKEQNKIGHLFEKIQHLINLHQRKVNILKRQKRLYFKKLFPQVNNNIPDMRYSNFKKQWAFKKLKELFIMSGSGGTPKSTVEEYYNGDIPFLSITDITNSDGYIYKTDKTISEEGLENSAAWLIPAGSVSLAMYASVGKLAILKIDLATSQAFYNMIFDNDDIRDFVYQSLYKANMFNEWEKFISTGTQKNLNAEKVKNFIIKIPYEGQEIYKINQTMFKIDSLITQYERKILLFKKLKEVFLYKMFI